MIEQLLLDSITMTVKEIKGSKAAPPHGAPQFWLVLGSELKEA